MGELAGGTRIAGYTALHSGLKDAYLGGTLTLGGKLFMSLGANSGIMGKGGLPIVIDHNNGNVTLSATGGDLYLGYNTGSASTVNLRLSSNLKGSNGTTSIADTNGTLYYQGENTDTRYMRLTTDNHVSTDLTGSTLYPRLRAVNSGASTPDWIRVGASGGFGLLPYSNGVGNLGTSSWRFASVHAVGFHEDGVALSSKYASSSTTLTGGTGIVTSIGNLSANRTISLDTTYTDGRYVNKAGDTMPGTLSINTGSSTALTLNATDANGNSTNELRFLKAGTTNDYQWAMELVTGVDQRVFNFRANGTTGSVMVNATGGFSWNGQSLDNRYLNKAGDSFTGAITATNRQAGIYGTYSSSLIDHVWSMGTAYKIDSAGANFGNLYGMAYKHTNNTTGGTMAGGHQIVFVNNGTPGAAIGMSGNIWASGTVTAAGGSSYINQEYLRLNGQDVVRNYDSWLRLNPNGHFTSGIYCSSSLLRTDGELQVGSSGSIFRVETNGNVRVSRDLFSAGGIVLGSGRWTTTNGLVYYRDDNHHIRTYQNSTWQTIYSSQNITWGTSTPGSTKGDDGDIYIQY